MPKVALQICAQMENVTNLKADGEDFRWYMKMKCEHCGEDTNFVYLTRADSYPLSGGRGHANLVLKCKLCKRENSVAFLPDSLAPYTADDAGKYKTIVKFDCRGMRPFEFSPRVGWVAEGTESKTPFSIDFGEKEWYDYDEKASETVSITEVLFQFEVTKH